MERIYDFGRLLFVGPTPEDGNWPFATCSSLVRSAAAHRVCHFWSMARMFNRGGGEDVVEAGLESSSWEGIIANFVRLPR